MIDYEKPDDDPIVAEVREIRAQIMAEFNYDLDAISLDMQRQAAAENRVYADRKPVASTIVTQHDDVCRNVA